MKKAARIISVVLLVMFIGSCMTNTHTIGSGPESGVEQEKKQWYVLWGLIPLGNVDTAELADNAENYEIKTYYGPLDFLVNMFLGAFSFQTRTVVVTK